jgi:sterol desaturase/sphingolipid hydroxylase (fatty acid hydroxylase superfamily)
MFPRALVHSRIGGWVITASHHQRHHDAYACNYGLYFRFWDRLCGTDGGLAGGSTAGPPLKALI